MKGTHYLVLKNVEKLDEKQITKLHQLLTENVNLNTLYTMKEQLQALWSSESVALMQDELKNGVR
jgi:hypothetical protein